MTRPLLVCEDLFLLLTKPSGGPISMGWSTSPRRLIQIGMVTAVVADAIAAGKVMLTGDRKPRVVVLDATPTGVPAIDRVLPQLLRRNGQNLAKVVSDRHLDPLPDVLSYLEERSIIGRIDARLGGLTPSRYPMLDASAENDLRTRMRSAILGGPVDFHDATLLAIVQGLGVAKSVFPLERGELGSTGFHLQMKLITTPIPVTRVVADVRQTLENNSAGAFTAMMCLFVVLLSLSTL